MKPNGVRIGIQSDGSPTMYVPKITRTEDKIWEAVEEAISEGWTPRQFRIEVEESWEYAIKEKMRVE